MFLSMSAAATAPPPLLPHRVHEVCGPGAHGFAAIQAALHKGPVLWIGAGHAPERLFPPGLVPVLDPSRLIAVGTRSETDLLWATEEGLRAGPLGLVVASPDKPLSLTAGRRLQLAAEAGRTTGLLLVRAGAGSNATETRWQAAPVLHADGVTDQSWQEWSLLKNKKGTNGTWILRWDAKARSLLVVSPPGERTRLAPLAL